jgi:hypothetical protein
MEPVMHPEEVRPTLVPAPADNRRSTRKPFQWAAFAAFLVLSVVFLAGCGIFDPPRNPEKPPDPPPVYLVPFLPQNVLTNLELAYSHRDSVACQAIYDSSYVGTSQDLNDPPNTTPSEFFYTDEVHHVAALYHLPTITSVSFSLGPATSWDRIGSNDPSHPDWAVIQIAGSSLDIQVTDSNGDNTWQASGQYEFFEFAFKPTPPAPGSPSDTLWKIVRWTETRSFVPPGG